MKRLSTIQLIPGMVVAEDVLSINHQLITTQGTVLTENLIAKLDLYGILTVYVEDEMPGIAGSPETFPELSHSEQVKQSPAFQQFKADYDANVDQFRITLNGVVEKNIDLDADTLVKNTLDMVSAGRGQFTILDMLQNLREYDDSTFAHCLNVGLICNVLATWLKLSPDEIEMATACGLFHDVGKLMIPHSIISKPDKLDNDEYALIQKHPVSGYQLLQSQHVDEQIRNAALMHHERLDGSGYPMRLSGSQIDPYARIVAIADVYDAMTASRPYRGPLCPFRVIETFEQDGFLKYDVEYLMTFLENVVNTYLQNRCRLNDDRVATIVYVNKDKLSRPTVQCESEYINLMDHPDLTIVELL